MWTYFTILFSFVLLVTIFARRAYLHFRKKTMPEPAVQASKEQDESEGKKVRIAKDDREKVETLCKRGEALIQAGKDEEAIKCFVQALTIDAVHLETQQKLAMLYLQKQLYSAAAALFQQLAKQTNDAVHYSHWGLALYQQSDLENAKIAYQTAVDLDPSRPQRFVSLSQVYKALGQMNNAMIAVNKAIEIDQQNLEFLYLLADLQMEAGNYIAARETAEKILAMDAGNKHATGMLKEIGRLEKEGGK